MPTLRSIQGKQEPHPARSHEGSGHSVLSIDFGYCSRTDDESDKYMLVCQGPFHKDDGCNSNIAKRWKIRAIFDH